MKLFCLKYYTLSINEQPLISDNAHAVKLTKSIETLATNSTESKRFATIGARYSSWTSLYDPAKLLRRPE